MCKYLCLLYSFLLSSVDYLCKQFGPRSGLTERWSWSRFKPFDSLIVFLKQFFEKVNFGPRSGQAKCWSWSRFKPFDTLIMFLKFFFEKVNFEKSQQMTAKAWKITQHAMSLAFPGWICSRYQNLVDYCRANQKWHWRNILFTIVKSNINLYSLILTGIDRSLVY